MSWINSLDASSLDPFVGTAAFILSLREKGIRNTPVLRAMEQVPRDLFAPQRFRDLARTDVALPLPCGQTMTGPTTIALMLSALDIQPGVSVLEVGTGSGYVTALLAQLGAKITSVERYSQLSESAKERLKVAGVDQHITLEVGDGLATRLRGTWFDRVLLNGTLISIPHSITSILPKGGKLVGALSHDGSPKLIQINKQADGTLKQEFGAGLRLSPLVNKIGIIP